jgi:uncharacterized protein YigA (DUF484 family)
MNDKEAFEKWYAKQDKAGVFGNDDTSYVELAWEAACAYKKEEYSNIMDAMTKTSQNNAELQAKNAELEKKLTDAENWKEIYGASSESRLEKLKIAVEALEFYGEINNSLTVHEDHPDREKFPTLSGGLYMTGRRARQALAVIKKINED